MNTRSTKLLHLTVAIVSFFVSMCATKAAATTVIQISTEDLVSHAEIVFKGEAFSSRAEMSDNGQIYTYVNFRIDELIKGEFKENELQLRFSGGEVDGSGQDYGIDIPSVGEIGIYFVTISKKNLYNPIVGWSQGQFTITDENQVVSANGGVVVEINFVESPKSKSISSGVAQGVLTKQRSKIQGPVERALSPEEFKLKIRAIEAEVNQSSEQIGVKRKKSTLTGVPFGSP